MQLIDRHWVAATASLALCHTTEAVEAGGERHSSTLQARKSDGEADSLCKMKDHAGGLVD